MELILNGQTADLSDFEADELAQAVLISLFSWRKSADDDGVKAPAPTRLVGRHLRIDLW